MLTINYKGKLIFVKIRDTIVNGRNSDCDVIREIYDENVYDINRDNFEDGVVLDIGGHIGLFAIFAVLNGAKKVYAIEPDKENFKLLKENIELNAMQETIIPINRAVLDSGYSTEIYLNQSNGVMKDVKEFQSKEAIKPKLGETQNIKTMTLSDLFSDYRIDCVDVCKMDIEWSEYKIIESTRIGMLRRIKYLTMEFHGTDKEHFGSMVSKLTEGFRVNTLGDYKKGGMLYATRY